MSRFQAAQFRRDPVESRAAVRELMVLALRFDELDVRVDRTTAAIDQLLRGFEQGGQSEPVDVLRALRADALAQGGEGHLMVLHVEERLGGLLLATGAAAEAVDVLRAAARGNDQHFGPESLPALGVRIQLARALALTGQSREAMALLSAVLASDGARPSDPAMLEARLSLAELHFKLGDHDAAVEAFEAARELAERHHRADLAYLAVVGQGWVRFTDGDLHAADRAFRDAEQRARGVRMAGPGFSVLLRGQGSLALARGDLARALALYGRALELAESGTAGHYEVQLARGTLALGLVHAGRAEEARRLADGLAAELPDDGESLAGRYDLLILLAEIESRLDLGERAVRHAELALESVRRTAGKDDLLVAYARRTLARAQVAAGKEKKAVKEATAALDRIEGHFGPTHVASVDVLVVLASAQVKRKKAKEALALADRALAVLEQSYGSRSPMVAEARTIRAAALDRKGDAQAAEREREVVARLGASHRTGGAAIAALPGSVVEMARYNFRVEPPGPEWRSAEPGAFGGARVALYRDDPPVIFAVLTEPAGVGEYTAEFLEHALRTNLRNENDDVSVERAGPRSVAGIPGAEVVARVVRGTSMHRLALWAGRHGDHVYRLVLYGEDLAVSAEQHDEQAEQMLASFSLIDPGAAPAGPAPTPGIQYASERFGYEVDLAGTRWGEWPRQSVEQPNAEFGAIHPEGGILLVMPVALLGTQPGRRIAVRGLLGLLDVETPAQPREVQVGDLSGVEFDFSRTLEGIRYDGRIRALVGPNAGYAVLALADRSLGESGEELLRVIETPRFSEEEPARLRADDLTPLEKRGVSITRSSSSPRSPRLRSARASTA